MPCVAVTLFRVWIVVYLQVSAAQQPTESAAHLRHYHREGCSWLTTLAPPYLFFATKKEEEPAIVCVCVCVGETGARNLNVK